MKKKKIFVLLGNPDKDTNSGYFMDRYDEGAIAGGHEVRRANIGDLKFDPILHKGYKKIQELEPDLVKLQEDIKWCDHFVIIYPVWWSTMPALLKGMFDRMWLPGFAFKFLHGGLWWNGLLRGKTARVFVVSDNYPIISNIVFGDTTNEIKKGILWFAGFSVQIKKYGPMKNLSEKKRFKWGREIYNYGLRGE